MLRVREILKEKGMSAKELARKMGISESALSICLRPDSNPTVGRLQEIADALGVPITDLFVVPTTLRCPKCGASLELRLKGE